MRRVSQPRPAPASTRDAVMSTAPIGSVADTRPEAASAQRRPHPRRVLGRNRLRQRRLRQRVADTADDQMPPVGRHLVLRVRQYRTVHQYRPPGQVPTNRTGGRADQMFLRKPISTLHPTGSAVRPRCNTDTEPTPTPNRHRTDTVGAQREQHRCAPPVVHRVDHELLRERNADFEPHPNAPTCSSPARLVEDPYRSRRPRCPARTDRPEIPHPAGSGPTRSADRSRPAGSPGRPMRVPHVGRVLPQDRQRRTHHYRNPLHDRGPGQPDTRGTGGTRGMGRARITDRTGAVGGHHAAPVSRPGSRP